MLSRNTDSLFLYLKHPVPKDTNGIEGVFSQLDTKLSRHRGMSRKRREDLISWYFYLREFPNSAKITFIKGAVTGYLAARKSEDST